MTNIHEMLDKTLPDSHRAYCARQVIVDAQVEITTYGDTPTGVIAIWSSNRDLWLRGELFWDFAP